MSKRDQATMGKGLEKPWLQQIAISMAVSAGDPKPRGAARSQSTQSQLRKH